MARVKHEIGEMTSQEVAVLRRSKAMPNPVIPTENPRHMTAIRLGRVSGEIFSRKNREAVQVDPDIAERR